MDAPPEPCSLQIFAEPILSDVDFVGFDLTNQTFGITPQGATRLCLKLWELMRKEHPGSPGCGDTPYVYWNETYDLIPTDTPFVLMASGEPIYAGWFYTMASAITPPGPLVEAETPFVSVNLATNVWFRIEPGRIAPPRSAVTSILLAQFARRPSDLEVKLADVRGDRRIVIAVQKLFSNRGK
jgi:hypothetical protein